MRPPSSASSERTTEHAFGDEYDEYGEHGEDFEPDFSAIQQSPEFARLRRRLRLFVFPVSALFFCWYMVFALLSAYDHAFMKQKVSGEINVGTVFGLLQFVSTIAIVLTYRHFAAKKLDPQVDRIHELAGIDRQ